MRNKKDKVIGEMVQGLKCFSYIPPAWAQNPDTTESPDRHQISLCLRIELGVSPGQTLVRPPAKKEKKRLE